MEKWREVLAEIGSNRAIDAGKPIFEPALWAQAIEKRRRLWTKEIARFEPKDFAVLPTQKDAFASQFPIWSG